MAERFLDLSATERRDALEVAGGESGRPVHLLEKDVWVVWALSVVGRAPFGAHLVFKGGTSLSKGYDVIRRFSEDVDLTYSIREIAPDLVGDGEGECIPPSANQANKWTKAIRQRLAQWVETDVAPTVRRAAEAEGLALRVSERDDTVLIDYEGVSAGSAYVSPTVKLEFGARSTGEPCGVRAIGCDAAPFVPRVAFPEAAPRVMAIERTFWEKATLMHVYCRGGKSQDRLSRHWHDVARLTARGHAAVAARDGRVREQVARHKALFFSAKGSDGRKVDYEAAVAGELELIPSDAARLALLREDYERMVADGLLLDEEPFEAVLGWCAEAQELANGQE